MKQKTKNKILGGIEVIVLGVALSLLAGFVCHVKRTVALYQIIQKDEDERERYPLALLMKMKEK